jgi:predicted N-acetyltransferase YhbS
MAAGDAGLGQGPLTGFSVREANTSDAPGIRELFARVFGKELSAEEWEWKFARNPDGWFGVVAESEGRIVGNYAGWGRRLLVAGEPRLAYAVGDVATDPDERGVGGLRGVYRAMVEVFYEAVGRQGVPFCFGFPNARALAISNRIAGTETMFPIVELRVRCDAFPPPPREVVASDSIGEEVDPLWKEGSRHVRDGPARDRSRLNWRFHARPTKYYRMLTVRRSGAPESWAALSVLGETAVVADFLGSAPDGSDLPRLFAAAAAEALRCGARELLFWESPGNPARAAIASLPVERRDAGFVVAARLLDSPAARDFFSRCHLPPSVYDVI